VNNKGLKRVSTLRTSHDSDQDQDNQPLRWNIVAVKN